MTTIVSAFISNVNSRKDRNIDTYYLLGKIFLKSTTPKIIFLDENMYNLIQDDDYDKNNTHIIKYNKNDCYLYNYIKNLNKFNLNTDNHSKDTIEYMFIQCNKTEWIRKAIEIDPFKSNNYVWIDFGIRQNFNCQDNEFIEKLNKLYYKNYDKVRIGNIWNLEYRYNINILTQISWYFAGGVFGGDKKSLLKFSDLMKEKCIDIISNNNTIMWEVNIWFIIYNKYPELFSTYLCNHNNTIIDNY
jgi:hypothetical protein